MCKRSSKHLDLPLKLVKLATWILKRPYPSCGPGYFSRELILGGLFTYFVSREAYKDGLKVLLLEGADELFGGYKSIVCFWKNHLNLQIR